MGVFTFFTGQSNAHGDAARRDCSRTAGRPSLGRRLCRLELLERRNLLSVASPLDEPLRVGFWTEEQIPDMGAFLEAQEWPEVVGDVDPYLVRELVHIRLSSDARGGYRTIVTMRPLGAGSADEAIAALTGLDFVDYARLESESVIKFGPDAQEAFDAMTRTAIPGETTYHIFGVEVVAAQSVPIEMRTTAPDSIDLGAVDYLELTDQTPDDGELWYKFEATRDAILTIQALPVSFGLLVLTGDPEITLYEFDDQVGLQELATFENRFDYHGAVSGGQYFMHVKTDEPSFGFRLANLVAADSQEGTATVYGSGAEDRIRVIPEPVFLAGTNADQQGRIDGPSPFSLVMVNGVSYVMGAPYSQSIRILADENDEVELGGSNGGDDTLESGSRSEADPATPSGYRVWRTAEMSGHWGQVYAEAGSITAKGFGGHDTARLWYTKRLGDTFVASPTQASMTAGNLSTTAIGFEDVEGILDYGRGGRAELYGSAEADSMEGTGAGVTLWGDGYSLSVRSADDVLVDALAGHDTAQWHSSFRRDTVTATPSSVSFGSSKPPPTVSGWLATQSNVTDWGLPSVRVQADNFELVEAYTNVGGGALATFLDSPGQDVFEGNQTYSEMTYDGGNVVRVHGYPTVVATSAEGGDDEATINDSPGDDTLKANDAPPPRSGFPLIVLDGTPVAPDPDATQPTTMVYGAGGTVQVDGFQTTSAVSSRGGKDVAFVYDSPGDDFFIATPTSAEMRYGDGSVVHVSDFRYVHAYAKNGGTDVAKLYDSPGNDVFVADPTLGTLTFEDGSLVRAKFFDYVHAYAKRGGTDVARLYDSGGVDSFDATPVYGRLYGDGFYNRAKFFEYVHGYSKAGGKDVATFEDSPGDDTFTADSAVAVLSGPGFYNRAKRFVGGEAKALERDDFDTATITGYAWEATGDWESLSAPPRWILFLPASIAQPNSSINEDAKDSLFAAGAWDQ